jgi:hypothetical protein
MFVICTTTLLGFLLTLLLISYCVYNGSNPLQPRAILNISRVSPVPDIAFAVTHERI